MILFAFFGIWQATLGIGVGAVAIPVIIHLINRKRFKIVPWAAMKFLLAAQKQTRRRMRIEQLLLLLVRMAILAFVVFAMWSVMPLAEEWWTYFGVAKLGPAVKSRPHRTHHIFVLDASLSMNQKVEGDQTAFEVARQMVLRKIADNSSGDGYSVLILKDSPTWLVGEASQNTSKVINEIKSIKPSHGNSSLSAALNMVAAKLSEARSRFPIQAVYFFTDMQNATWMAAAPSDATGREKNPYLEIKDKATTIFVDCGPLKDSVNLGVTHMEFDLNQTPYVTTGMDFTLLATVKNYGAEAKFNVRPELLIGKAKDAVADPALQLRVSDPTEKEDIAAHSQVTFKFNKVKFDQPGTYAVQVKLPDDALDQDNFRTIIITVRDEIPVLLVNGKASADRFERATEFLRLALNPFPSGTEPKWAPLRPKVVSPSQFTEMTEAELEKYDCIYWCDVQLGPNDNLRKVDSHLRRGGGLIVTLGDNALKSLDVYNRLLFKDEQGLLPAKFMKRIAAPPDHNFYLHTTDDNAYSIPPLAAFSDGRDRHTLRTARFLQFVESEVPEGKARTVLSFMPEVPNFEGVKRDLTLPVNKPAIVEWNPPLSRQHQPGPALGKPGARVERAPARYRGKVILFTSTVNMDWASWPGSPSFGAMMHELTRLGVSGRLREQSQTVGGLLDAFLPGGAEIDVVVKYPPEMEGIKPGKAKTQLIDEVNLFRWADTDFAGVYRVETTNGHEIPFAVNVPTASTDQKTSESDLTRIEEGRLKELYPDWTFQIVRDPLRAMLSGGPINDSAVDVPQPVGPDLANIALLIVLGLLFAEIVMAWYFGHYTTTEGALSKAPPGITGTLVAAFIALMSTIFFVIGAIVIIHEIRTGDFLSFLPDLLRNWFERAVDVPPLQPGEGSKWVYEKQSFLFGLPGPESWYAVLLSIGAVVTIFFTYKAEAPKVSLVYKLLLGALRLYLILLTLWFLLPRPQLVYARQGWPDLVILIDDTRSMGEPDTFRDGPVIEKVKKLSEGIRERLQKEIPDKITALTTEIVEKSGAAEKDQDIKADVDSLKQRQHYWQKQLENLQAGKWRPSRLQLVQAILAQPEPHWLKTILKKHQTKIHIFHLDVNGRATKLRDLKGDAGDIVDPNDPNQVKRAEEALARLEPVGNDSRLGSAVRQVIDHYRGSGLSSVIMFTDGVTTRDETLSQAADYAAQKGIPLFFIGVGDENELRDLKLQDLSVDDPIYIGDNAVFEVRLTGQGYKDLTVPVILKLRDKDGKEKEVAREMAKVDPAGKAVKIKLRHTPKEVGRKKYIIEVEPPKLEPNEKPIPPANLRLETAIEVIDTKLIKVLYVEGQPRYEYRYIKFLLEREAPDEKQKKKKSIDLKVLLLDADADFFRTDKTALEHFPPTLELLNEYDVLILGDVDPANNKLKGSLKDIVAFVNGEDEKGRKALKPGGGILFIAGAFNNPHRYLKTPLEKILPVEPAQDHPPPEVPHETRLRTELTPAGRGHMIFNFGPNEGENVAIWSRLTPMYWYSTKYRPKPLAEVLVEKAEKEPNGDGKHPLVVSQFAGSGRSMFFGFDETWRWRRGDDESKFNKFWIQTMRYLSRGRPTRTELKLDRQTPYQVGEKIKITVRFPESTPGGGNPLGPKIDETTKVKVIVEHTAPEGKDSEPPRTIELAKAEGSRGTYQGTWDQTREGKWRFRLTHPDVSVTQPDNEKPSAEALVELPPGELDKLRMDYQEMTKAAATSNGQFFTLARADEVLDVIPEGDKPIMSSQVPPTLLWNQWWVFVLIVLLITSEWVLRKLKHLL